MDAPTQDRWAGWTVPKDYVPVSIDRCRGCSAIILWAKTPNDRYSPHDRNGASHFATCPRADVYRRRRGRRAALRR